jgi:hypothetical protein
VSDELRQEYHFDYSKAKPNRFAAAPAKGGILVVLDPDVAAAFRESGALNAVLRAFLHTMPDRSASQVIGAKPSTANGGA